MLAFEDLGLDFPQLGIERVARRDHAERLVAVDDRHMAESAVVHHQQRLLDRPIGRDRLRLRRHHVGQRRLARIAAFGKHAEHGIALGEDADEPAAVDDHQCADVVLFHRARGRRDRRVAASHAGLASRDRVCNGSMNHGAVLLTCCVRSGCYARRFEI